MDKGEIRINKIIEDLMTRIFDAGNSIMIQGNIESDKMRVSIPYHLQEFIKSNYNYSNNDITHIFGWKIQDAHDNKITVFHRDCQLRKDDPIFISLT